MIITKEQKITLVAAGLLLLTVVIVKVSGCMRPKIEYTDKDALFDKKIEQLDKRIKQQEIERKKTDSLLLVFQDSMIVLKYAIKSKDQQIKNLKAQHEKNRIDISKFTNADIEKFLSNRYGK